MPLSNRIGQLIKIMCEQIGTLAKRQGSQDITRAIQLLFLQLKISGIQGIQGDEFKKYTLETSEWILGK